MASLFGGGEGGNVKSVTQILHILKKTRRLNTMTGLASAPDAVVKGRGFVTVQRAAGLDSGTKSVQTKIWLPAKYYKWKHNVPLSLGYILIKVNDIRFSSSLWLHVYVVVFFRIPFPQRDFPSLGFSSTLHWSCWDSGEWPPNGRLKPLSPVCLIAGGEALCGFEAGLCSLTDRGRRGQRSRTPRPLSSGS